MNSDIVAARPVGNARVNSGAPPPLPPLRDEIILEAGPSLRGGAPSWTLYDPASNRFFRISWLEFEILCRWHLRRAQEIVNRVNRETTLSIDVEDIEQLTKFLDNAELLRRSGAQDISQLVSRKQARKQNWLAWMTHHYLFVRIPLLRPDAALKAMLPWLDWVYSRGFLILTLLAALAGLFLAQRQWDSFLAAMPWFFSLEGIALAGLALLAAKALHELAHGLTAVRYGCRVPTMGVALLVLAPVLYTDTTDAWRLRDRKQRLAIGGAGVAVELYLAAYALLLWSFLPDGILRSVVYVWATTTWILTVLIHVSPFLRFDGYYLLSDLIDVPNLQERAFALTRHRIREFLFSFGEESPEYWSPRMRSLLIAYAIGTWVYRFILFLGIALIVYHMFFKALGIVLFVVEIWYFIARPVVNELVQWSKRISQRKINLRSLITLSVFVLAMLWLCFPWRTPIYAPALMAAQNRVQLYLPAPGQVAAVHVGIGARVIASQPLVTFISPDLEYRARQAARNVESLTTQAHAASLERVDQARAYVLRQQLESARAEHHALTVEQERLIVRSPITGTVVELADPLGVGEWFKAGEAIGFVVDMTATRIDAYVEEADLERIRADTDAVFIPTDAAGSRVAARVASIEETAVRTLSDQELASIRGGVIATRQDDNQQAVPEAPVYRVRLVAAENADAPLRTVTGTALLQGEATSALRQIWRRLVSVLLRESGF